MKQKVQSQHKIQQVVQNGTIQQLIKLTLWYMTVQTGKVTET